MELDQLFKKSQELPYDQSNGMKVATKMRGPGFFPGCTGTTTSLEKLDDLPIMVLGQDFDTEENHARIDEVNGEINSNTTWRNLKTLLHQLGVDASQCFFTNAYMGLRPNNTGGKTKNTGESPAAKKRAENFAEQCRYFFKFQLKNLQSELVLVLGKETAKFICKTFPEDFKHWQGMGTLRKFYDVEENVSVTIKFEGRAIRFVFVIHPSLNNTNRSKIWGKKDGKNHEQKMLQNYIPIHLRKNNPPAALS